MKAASRFVPYITDAVLTEARDHLPHNAESRLTAADVDRFVSETADAPDTRMAVLGVLRAHSSNGAEVGVSVTALLVSVLGVTLNLLSIAAQPDGWWQLIPILEAIGIMVVASLFIRVAVAAHVRKMTAVTWLGAYEDALTRSAAKAAPPRTWLGRFGVSR